MWPGLLPELAGRAPGTDVAAGPISVPSMVTHKIQQGVSSISMTRNPASQPIGEASDTIVLGTSHSETAVFAAGFPILGAALGIGAKLAADWIAGLPWAPFQGPFRLIAQIPEPWVTIVLPVLGVIAGIVLVMIMLSEQLTMTLTGRQMELKRGDDRQQIMRSEIHDVFADRKELVVLGAGGAELAREAHEVKSEPLQSGFVRLGYPWRADGDPYAGTYRRWVPGDPSLPSSADALLHARGRALEKGEAKDLRELRRELNALGVVVRDRDKRQYWRTVTDRR